ncbi:hypothetical protein MMYC01_210206 [Madurella mycetomatis]|uniref:Uncharacterized protein n=1 Tax=Madurella mycetomatis TaxID=100816 RepID=A0A175VPF4_9PEZI|nr:hypothetical protein MMYC01_210206 [Madurella mycetomatis]
METIHNITNAASKAIWGDTNPHEEPVSGKMGNVAAGEPYDAGNIGEPNEAALSPAEQHDTETEEVPIKPPATGAGSGTEQARAAATPLPPTPAPEAQTSAGTKTGAVATEPKFQEQQEEGAQTINPTTVPSASGMRDDSTKAQNDTRAPPPSTAAVAAASGVIRSSHDGNDNSNNNASKGPQTEEEENEQGKEAAAETRPVRVEGPGPRPIAEVAREHGGDAGAVDQPHGEEEGAGHRRRDSAKGLGGEGREAEDEGEAGIAGMTSEDRSGTGEMYVRSSGLAAEGGDFDASRPGAGREADRLLEQKGVHKREGAEVEAGEKHNGNGGKEKTSLKSKIKAKLHKPSLSA